MAADSTDEINFLLVCTTGYEAMPGGDTIWLSITVCECIKILIALINIIRAEEMEFRTTVAITHWFMVLHDADKKNNFRNKQWRHEVLVDGVAITL